MKFSAENMKNKTYSIYVFLLLVIIFINVIIALAYPAVFLVCIIFIVVGIVEVALLNIIITEEGENGKHR
jgi:hypothetical protein